MISLDALPRQSLRAWVAGAFAAAILSVLFGTASSGEAGKVEVLRIGGTVGLTGEKQNKKEVEARDTLKTFIKEETGLANEILPPTDWRQLGDKLAKGELHLGVFQGYEFAWAQEKYPELKPLALAVNVYRYPVGYVIALRTNQAKDFAGLAGQSLSIPTTGPPFLRLYVERQAQAAGKKLNAFFSKVASPDNIEDAIDDVVEGMVQATVIDRAALEAYKRRKPGRFKELKEVAHSQPFPPPLVAYYGKILDEAKRTRFRDGLVGANKKEKGDTMLTLFHLTAFEAVPDDLPKVLAETRENYPPPTK